MTKRLLFLLFTLTVLLTPTIQTMENPSAGNLIPIDGMLLQWAQHELEKNPHALLKACEDGALGAATLLIECGAKVRKDFHLHAAIKNGHLEVVRLLINNGASLKKWKKGKVPLTVAIRKGFDDIVALLIASGAKINIRYGFDRTTPLHEAAENGNHNIVKILINAGADIHARMKVDVGDGTFYDNYLQVKQDQIKDEDIDTTVWKLQDLALMNVVENIKRYDAASYQYAQSINLPVINEFNNVLAHANLNNKKVKKILSSIIPEILEGQTPLHLAAEKNHPKVAEILIACGADVNAKILKGLWQGCTPLHFAVDKGHLEIVRLLIERGAEIDAEDRNGDTPLTRIFYSDTIFYSDAEGSRLLNVAQLLIASGANVNIQDRRGLSPLHYIAAVDPKLTQQLLEAGAQFMNSPKYGTPLRTTIKVHNLESVLALLAYTDLSNKGRCAMQSVLSLKSITLLQFLKNLHLVKMDNPSEELGYIKTSLQEQEEEILSYFKNIHLLHIKEMITVQNSAKYAKHIILKYGHHLRDKAHGKMVKIADLLEKVETAENFNDLPDELNIMIENNIKKNIGL